MIQGADVGRMTVPYGDDYNVSMSIVIPDGVDASMCTAVLGMGKDDEPSVGLQKSIEVGPYASAAYVVFSLAHADFNQLKPGLYHYDIEVRSVDDEFWTPVSSTLTVIPTFVKHA
jgi:hypothetical protein